MLGLDAGFRAASKELLDASMPKALDHTASVYSVAIHDVNDKAELIVLPAFSLTPDFSQLGDLGRGEFA